MKDKIYQVQTSMGIYPFCFNLNVMEELQNIYGSISAWGELVEKNNDGINVSVLKKGLTCMFNEAIDIENDTLEEKKPLLTEKQVGRILTDVGFKKMLDIVKEITVSSTKTPDDSKNA